VSAKSIATADDCSDEEERAHDMPVTGLEPALAKAATSAAVRAAGWTGRRLSTTWRKRRVKKLLKQPLATKVTDVLLADLVPDQAGLLLEFVSSPNFEHIAYELALEFRDFRW
jgi:hypothetical protein